MVNIKKLSMNQYLQVVGGWAGWAKGFFYRGYALKDGGKLEYDGKVEELPPMTIVVLAGQESNRKLMAHEYGHLIDIHHPEDRMGKTSGNMLQRAFAKVWCALVEGLPVSSAWGILRMRDPEGLIPKWETVEKRYI